MDDKSLQSKQQPEKEGSDLSLKDSSYVVKHQSHEDFDIEIQTNRVLYVLDETIKKIRIAAHMGYLSQNGGELLWEYLPTRDVRFFVKTCDLYMEATPMTDDENRSVISTTDTLSAKFNERMLLMKEKHDVNLLQCVDIIYACPNLMNFIANLEIEMDSLSNSLIQGMIELKSAAKDKLSVSATQERENKRTLKNAWKDNLEAVQLIEALEERLSKQNDELQVQLDAKEHLIEMYTEKIEEAEVKFNEDIKKRVATSEKAMIKLAQISGEKQQLLAQQAKEATQTYNMLLDQHLASEKLLRAKRFKVEAQLGSWLEKYDKEISERNTQLEELQAHFDAEKAEMDALQAKFDEQEEEYLELMAEKKEYDDGIFNKKYFLFLMNRSARKIQKCWRGYRERKKARRKARQKKRKGKGEAAEPEAAPAPVDTADTDLADVAKEMFGEDVDVEDEPLPAREEEVAIVEKGKKGKGKGKGGKKGKKKGDKKDITITREDDPNAILSKSKIASHVFESISTDPIPSGPVEVNLND